MEMPVWRRHMTRSGLCFDMAKRTDEESTRVAELKIFD